MKENIYIQEFKRIPRIEFEKNLLSISGRSISENADLIYIPILEKIDETKSDVFHIVIDLEYFNCRSTKYIFEILKKSSASSNTFVKWICESYDSDMIETASDIGEILGIEIKIILN